MPKFNSTSTTQSNNQLDNKLIDRNSQNNRINSSEPDNKSNLSSFRRKNNNYYSDCSSNYNKSRNTSPYNQSNFSRSKSTNRKLNYQYSTSKSPIKTGKSINIENELFSLKKEIERLKYDNFYLKEELRKSSLSYKNSNSNIKTLNVNKLLNDNDNWLSNSTYLPTYNKRLEEINFNEINTYENKCIRVVEKLQEILNTKSVSDTYSKIIEKLNKESKLNKVDELYSKLTDLYMNIHGKNSLLKLHQQGNVATVVKEKNVYEINDFKNMKNNLIKNKTNTTFYDAKGNKVSVSPSSTYSYYVTEVKAVWRWIKRLVQKTYFSSLSDNKKDVDEKRKDRKYSEIVNLINSIQNDYQLRDVSEIKRFIASVINKSEKQRSRVDKIKQILETKPIKSKSVSRSKSRGRLS